MVLLNMACVVCVGCGVVDYDIRWVWCMASSMYGLHDEYMECNGMCGLRYAWCICYMCVVCVNYVCSMCDEHDMCGFFMCILCVVFIQICVWCVS